VSYVDAGYAIALSVLFLYALALVVRRRRLERRVELTEVDLDAAGGGGKAAGVP
jgi:CcmD family protein